MTSGTFGCLNNTIKLHPSGDYFDLADPRPETIHIEDIASALSKLCRYGGHAPRFYSVAEHCVAATRLAYQRNESRRVCRAVLLHDAAEAYIGDVVKPLKIMLPEYATIEKKIEAAIRQRFGMHEHKQKVELYDRLIFKAEKLALFPNDEHEWTGFSETETVEYRPQFYTPTAAEREFFEMYNLLSVPLGERINDEEPLRAELERHT